MKRKQWLVVCATALAFSGCSTVGDVVPACAGKGVETTFLMTQSVPEAKYIPCIEAMPAGWSIDTLDVKSSGSRFSFSLDRAGVGALQMRLEPRCDVSGAERLPSDEPGTRLWEEPFRLEERYRASRYYLFPGGCVTYEFDLPQEEYTEALSDIYIAFTFQERAELQRAYRDRFEVDH